MDTKTPKACLLCHHLKSQVEDVKLDIEEILEILYEKGYEDPNQVPERKKQCITCGANAWVCGCDKDPEQQMNLKMSIVLPKKQKIS